MKYTEKQYIESASIQAGIIDELSTELKALKKVNEYQAEQLILHGVNCSYLPRCNRVEVIDKSDRVYTNYDCKSVETQMQDDNRTLKVFIS